MNPLPIHRFCESRPFIRLLLPFMAGIAVSDSGDGFVSSIPIVYPLTAAAFMLIAMALSLRISTWQNRAWYGIATTLFLVLAGWSLCSLQWERAASQWPSEKCIYEGRLTDEVSAKERSYLCPVQVTSIHTSDSLRSLSANILLYLPKTAEAAALSPGDKLRFYGEVKPPTNFSPTFDYVRHLRHRQVSGTLYTRHWQLTDTATVHWKTQALRVRSTLLDYYRSCGLSGDELSVLSALTLGYKNDLSETVREQYSISGASHVLALSGLHIGILCMVLTAFFNLFLRNFRHRHLCRLLTVPAIWGFVLLVGSPASAVRAAIMFSVLVISYSFNRSSGFPLNTLALTAFAMLIYNPFYLFDVGFQMSFSAVASILLIQPWLQTLLPRPRHGLLRYLWGITTVSLAAQVGVFPLILHYFSRLSPYALVVNLWIIPLTFLIVCAAVPFLLASLLPASPLQPFIGDLIGFFVRLMNSSLSLAARIPGADISGCSLNAVGTLFLYSTLFFLFYGLIHKHRRCFIGLLASLCGITASHIWG